MSIQDILSGLQQGPQAPTVANPALMPAPQALMQNPTAMPPPRVQGMGMPHLPLAPIRHDSSLDGLAQGAPGGSRVNGGLPALLAAMGNNDANSGTEEQMSSDNSTSQGS